MLTDKELKKQKIVEFRRDFEKYYPVKTMQKLGLVRKTCVKCGKPFWTADVKREICGDSFCVGGYTFIGKKVAKDLGYKGYYDAYVKYYKKFNYVPIKRYPVVARWYDKLYFVAAGVNMFQPYVVAGEVPPPAPAVLEDQFCLRFNDIDNVGITGRHYTGFIMTGHHVFNTPEKYVYFKDEGIEQFYNFFIKVMGLDKKELILHEDIWAGGGNFGPSIEFFAYGLELGNQVYMQYEQLPDGGYRELRTRVIDMGSGAERWPWIGSGELTSYDVVFPDVMKYLYKASGIKRDEKFWKEFAKFSANLNIDEVGDLEKAWSDIANKLKINVNVLKEKLLPVVALYSIADHTRTVLVALNDGELPSNVGGGYNLRNLLRRCFSFIEKYNWDIDLEKVFKIHLKEFGKWYTDLKESAVLFDVLRLEKERYAKTREEAKKIISKYKGKIDIQTLLTLYESNGITPELLSQIAPDLEIPAGFYAALDELKERAAAKKQELTVDVAEFPKTENMYRKDACTTKFEAAVIGQHDAYIILDKSYFYPRSGGQDYDLGTINGLPLKAVWAKDGVFLHELDKPHLFKKGEKVKCEIDSERRRKLTATHTAVHVVGDAARQVLGPHIHQAGSEKTIEKGRLDLTHYKPISFDELQKIEVIANETVKKGIKVHSEILPREKAEAKYGITIYQGGAVPGKQLRILTVGDDVQACGGTHVENTKDIKFIKIINAERIKDGIVRIEMMVADKALEKMQENEKILNDVSKMWDVPFNEIPKTANKFFEEWKEQKKELKELKDVLSQQLIDALVKTGEKHITLSLPTDELGLLIALANKTKLNKQTIVLKGKNVAYARSESELSAAKELEKFCNKVDGDAKKAKGFGIKQ